MLFWILKDSDAQSVKYIICDNKDEGIQSYSGEEVDMLSFLLLES